MSADHFLGRKQVCAFAAAAAHGAAGGARGCTIYMQTAA